MNLVLGSTVYFVRQVIELMIENQKLREELEKCRSEKSEKLQITHERVSKLSNEMSNSI